MRFSNKRTRAFMHRMLKKYETLEAVNEAINKAIKKHGTYRLTEKQIMKVEND